MSAVTSISRSSPGSPGTRQTVLCLHCSGGSGRQWRTIAAPLTRRFDVRAPELLGYSGPTGWPSGARVSLDDEAERLHSCLLDAKGPVHLLGHSYGGAVALQLALRWPERVASLTLYEPVRFALLLGGPRDSAYGDGPAKATANAAATAEAMAAARHEIVSRANRFGLAVMSGRLHQAAETFVDYWGGPGSWAAMDPRRRHLQAALMPKVHSEFQALLADRVPASAYEQLQMPARLIGGTRSPLPARMVMRRLAARLPNVSTMTLVDLDHMGPVKAAERVRLYLPAWLQDGEAMTDAVTGPVRSVELEAA